MQYISLSIKLNLCNNFIMEAAVVAQRHKNKPQCDRSVTSGPLIKTSTVWD